MRIATYTRISTDEDHQPYSLDAQATRLGSYAASQEGWAIVRRESDQKSGATLDRPGLQKLLREGEAGRFDLLLVYKVDRVARSVRGLAQIIERLDEANVLFRSATEPFDTASPAGRMMVQMLGVFAEFERATIVERVIAGMERKAARGEWAAGQVPYGYRRDQRLQFLVPDPAEVPVVRIIFERYADRLEGAQSIARWLAERGYRTRRGVPFNPKAVLTILRNRVYIGEIFFRGTHYAGPHEPLIDLSLFDLSRQLAGLKARREELADDRQDADTVLTDDDIAALQAEVAQTIRDGDAPTKKALLQALVGEIRIEGRDQIRPSYCLPAVRVAPPGGSVPLRGFEPRFPPDRPAAAPRLPG